MPPYADVYVIAPQRSAAVVARFLGRFAPRAEEVVEGGYGVPQYADTPAAHFGRASERVGYLAAHPSEPYGVYWRNPGQGAAFAMAFFTTDGALILGLSCVEADAEAHAAEPCSFAGAGPSCTLFEQPPPDSAEEFRRMFLRDRHEAEASGDGRGRLARSE